MAEARLVALLSTVTAPLLPRQIAALSAAAVDDLVVVFDARVLGEKDLRIFAHRTEEAFDGGPSLHDFARVPCHFVKSHNGEDCAALLQALSPALLVNAGTPRKLSRATLDLPQLGVINVHPGRLPDYRGASCVEWSIYNDDLVGNTAHFMAEDYDDGPVLEFASTPLEGVCRYPEIRIATYNGAIALMARTVRRVLDERLTPEQLPEQGDGRLHRPIPPELMAEVERKVAEGRYRPS